MSASSSSSREASAEYSQVSTRAVIPPARSSSAWAVGACPASAATFERMAARSITAWAALAGGATWPGVAQATEALELRAGGITARVLTWLYSADASLDELLEADIDVSVSGALSLNQVLDAVRATGRTARVHVKVDTGLGRSGVPPRELASLLAAAVAAQAEGMLEVVGIWSHLAWADAPDHPTVLAQAR